VGASRGESLARLAERYGRERSEVVALLAAVPAASLSGEERRALEAVRKALENELPPTLAPAEETSEAIPDCVYDAASLARGPNGREALSSRIYACFGRAAQRIEHGGKTLDRLTVLGLLATSDDAAARRALFFSLQPVWRSVNGDGGPSSPYRSLIRLSAAEWESRGSAAERSASALGIPSGELEGWLIAVLSAWKAATAERVEPWDYWYAAGKASREISPKIPLERLAELNEAYYRDLGADPVALGIRYDLAPRAGKTPVAFTTFGSRGTYRGGLLEGAEPWVFATYRSGGFDNLEELLHETAHAVHIAAIRTRPAFADWPEVDAFTEALGDLLALEVYEPEWQERYLGASVPLSDSLRGKYSSVVMDTAWSLFEIRMHRDPAADPNRVWTELTSEYLHVVPHAELSWWAVRGQLASSPGYMVNYGIGAIVAADLRARARELRGPFSRPDRAWYGWLSERLYRFGLERSSREVLEGFLGRPLSPRALLDDMSRASR
jgi:hypothetical protein